jgi:SAM-dependent methyltransferase
MTIERERPRIGTMPAATEKDDETYLDFVEGIRVFNVASLSPTATQVGEQALAQREAELGRRISSIDEAHQVLDTLPIIQTRWRVVRTSQEMFWNGVIDTYRKREPELLAELDRADRMGPGSVEYDPTMQLPEYITHAEIHIQPGSYHADPLAGYIYHYGTKVFNQGRNDNDEIHRDNINKLPIPADGRVNRILDLACSVGQGTTAFKERFPNAEVWGIDAGAPMVRYAHKRAVEMGLDVHFAQRLTEDNGFPDNYFDIVNAFILFHELPRGAAEQTIREAYRVLRPGGVFTIIDFQNTKHHKSALQLHTRHMDETHNGEPYSTDFVKWDFAGFLATVFPKVEEGEGFLPLRVCTK